MRNRDIIKQYVNTGNVIPEYQFNKLNKNLLNSYLRKRLIGVNKNSNFEPYEWLRINIKQQEELIDIIGLDLILYSMPNETAIYYINQKRFDVNSSLNAAAIFRFFIDNESHIEKEVYNYYFNGLLHDLKYYNKNEIFLSMQINSIILRYIYHKKQINIELVDAMKEIFQDKQYVLKTIDGKLIELNKILNKNI